MAEKKEREIVRTIELIYFVSKYYKKIEIKCLLKQSSVRLVKKPTSVGIESAIALLSIIIIRDAVNKPTSVGIDPVSSFESINILRGKIREQVRSKGRISFV